MPVFTPSHLGNWEQLYLELLEGETFPLAENIVSLLGSKPGIIAVLHESEPIYIESSKDISKTLMDYLSGSSACDFRVQVAVGELGASARTAPQRVGNGPLSARVNRALSKFRFNAVPATAGQVDKLASAFRIVADPRLNGPTARANAVIDALPKK